MRAQCTVLHTLRPLPVNRRAGVCNRDGLDTLLIFRPLLRNTSLRRALLTLWPFATRCLLLAWLAVAVILAAFALRTAGGGLSFTIGLT